MHHVIIYTDGCCKGNPGNGGWGAVLFWMAPNGRKYYKDIYGGIRDTTNNSMELQACIEALNCLCGECRVDLYTDSKYVIQGISSWIHNWKKNGWLTSDKKPVSNKPMWEQLDDLTHKYNVKYHWVKGHSNNKHNQRADMLANLGFLELLRPTSA